MVTVGVLAALINVGVLVVVSIADRAIEHIVRNFATCRLLSHRRAPVIHDSDTWLPFLPLSVLKFHKHPGTCFCFQNTPQTLSYFSALTFHVAKAILCTLFITVLLITSELVSELGIDVNRKCKPQPRKGPVISPNDFTHNFTDIELSGGCFVVQSVQFVEGQLKRVQPGIPTQLKGSECLSCLRSRHPDIISGCSVRQIQHYAPATLNLTVQTTRAIFKTITTSFVHTATNTSFTGYGDLTFNGEKYSCFLFEHSRGKSLNYLEYDDQQHIHSLKAKSENQYPNQVSEPTRSAVRKFRIRCKTNQLSVPNFAQVVRMYRTVQLENPITPAPFDKATGGFPPMCDEDIYRATLAAKIIDDQHIPNGTYYVYTSCGQYNWIFLLPMIVSLLALTVLFSASRFLGRAPPQSFPVPYNSRSWFNHAQELEEMHRSRTREETTASNLRTSRGFDEVMLVEGGIGATNEYRIAICPRSRHSRNEQHIEPDMSIADRAIFEEYA